ncbi:MAG: phospholipase D-like domain-containing protein [Endomicrobium sp.]|jgi:cardiolipin synthase|nr:phospholipase D-like domain-containing protein [Endomicrobium sp.]
MLSIFSNFTKFNFQGLVLAIFYLTLAITTSIHILLHKDDIKSSIGWIALVFLSPFIGTILYIFLGINRVKRKSLKLKGSINLTESYSKVLINNIFENLPINYKQFINFSHKVYSQNFVFGNLIEPLQNGFQAYPEMILAIKEAKKEVLISSYIFDYDSETEKILDALKVAINNGAKIKVLIDGIGTFNIFGKSIEKKLKEIKGLQYGIFLPLKFPLTFAFVNLRNHKKIMMIDGETAFFGGMNLSKNNCLIGDKKNAIIDITFKINGPVIQQIAEIFEEDWEFVTGEKFNSIAKSIKYKNSKGLAARAIPGGPDKQNNAIELIALGAISAAIKKILIITPYFLPEKNILTSIEMAAMRGIEVEIILPKIHNSFISKASEANFLSLINRGVKIFHTHPPFDHSKIFVVDSEWVFVGSANWDVRSFKLNFESNMEIFSKSLARTLETIAKEKKEKATVVTADYCKNMSTLKKLRNNMYRLLTPYG